jgi:hypothetical protein
MKTNQWIVIALVLVMSASCEMGDVSVSDFLNDLKIDKGGDDDEARPASCAEIHAADPSAPSGVYTIASALPKPYDLFETYCDMENDGGGWTLVMSWPNGTCAPIEGWDDPDAALGTGFADPDKLFKLPDDVINTIRVSMFRGQGGASRCLQGPCDVSVKLFWGKDCVYSSSSNSIPCSTAYLDSALTIKTPAALLGPNPCGHHFGLNDVNCGFGQWDPNGISSFISSHLDLPGTENKEGVAVGDIDSYVHSVPCRTESGYPENGWIKVWVR